MKFKVDENLPIEVVTLLRDAGHDALSIHDQRMVGHEQQGAARRAGLLTAKESPANRAPK